MTIRLETEAEDELDAAAAWYERQRAGLGQDFVDEVARSLARVSEAPRSFTLLLGVPEDLGVRCAARHLMSA